jgi:hypothetical protein
VSFFKPSAPADTRELMDALYAGEVFLLPPTAASLELADAAQTLLTRALGSDPRASYRGQSAEHFRLLGGLRRTLFTDAKFHAGLFRVVESLGREPADFLCDPLRLRVVESDGHQNPRAAPVYTPHRDTWYAHPQSLVTWWIPLSDTPEAETFVFYPDCFARAVVNDSHTFEYRAWVADGWDLKIGWQDREAGRTPRYPGALGPFASGPAKGFSCQRGEVLIFSGAHFHETRRHSSGRTRFSMDFRLVHAGDLRAGRGAPNADARARGSAVIDYVRPTTARSDPLALSRPTGAETICSSARPSSRRS